MHSPRLHRAGLRGPVRRTGSDLLLLASLLLGRGLLLRSLLDCLLCHRSILHPNGPERRLHWVGRNPTTRSPRETVGSFMVGVLTPRGRRAPASRVLLVAPGGSPLASLLLVSTLCHQARRRSRFTMNCANASGRPIFVNSKSRAKRAGASDRADGARSRTRRTSSRRESAGFSGKTREVSISCHRGFRSAERGNRGGGARKNFRGDFHNRARTRRGIAPLENGAEDPRDAARVRGSRVARSGPRARDLFMSKGDLRSWRRCRDDTARPRSGSARRRGRPTRAPGRSSSPARSRREPDRPG